MRYDEIKKEDIHKCKSIKKKRMNSISERSLSVGGEV